MASIGLGIAGSSPAMAKDPGEMTVEPGTCTLEENYPETINNPGRSIAWKPIQIMAWFRNKIHFALGGSTYIPCVFMQTKQSPPDGVRRTAAIIAVAAGIGRFASGLFLFLTDSPKHRNTALLILPE